jgi:cobalt/nickel transport system ATP-binding protein
MTNVTGTPVFIASNLSYGYAGNIRALDRITFSVQPGETVALVGSNGSGKSTLLKLLDGLIFPTGGEIKAFGRSLNERAFRDPGFTRSFRQQVGMVFQDSEAQLFSTTVWEEVVFGPMQLRLSEAEVESRANKAMEQMGISHLRERPPYLLSGGEKKKVALAAVLSMRPGVLLLDEPTNELDPSSQGKLIDFLLQWSAEGHTLIFSTQDLDLVEEVATRVIVLGKEHNVEADGRPEDFLQDREFLLRTNLIHEHSHRHKTLVHRHPHTHEHQHTD